MVTCRTYIIEKAPTPGFLLTANQYEFIGEGTFNTTLHISYSAGANKIVRIVNSDPISGDSCLSTDITLDTSGNKDVHINGRYFWVKIYYESSSFEEQIYKKRVQIWNKSTIRNLLELIKKY